MIRSLIFYNGAQIQLHITSIKKYSPLLAQYVTTFRKIAAERAVFFSLQSVELALFIIVLMYIGVDIKE